MIEQRDGKWHWECPRCASANNISVSITKESLIGNNVTCPKCGAKYVIAHGPSLSEDDGVSKRYIVTARLRKSDGRWVMPNDAELLSMTIEMEKITKDHGGNVIEARKDIRSVEIECSPATAVQISRDPNVAAVLPL